MEASDHANKRGSGAWDTRWTKFLARKKLPDGEFFPESIASGARDLLSCGTPPRPMPFFSVHRFVPLLALAVLALTGCERPAAREEGSGVETPLRRYDLDRDGVLSASETQAMNEAFLERFDRDGDGKLGVEERAAVRGKARIGVSVAPKARETEETAKSFVQRLDRNGDGVLEAGEMDETRWKVVSRADRDGDGKVTAAEWLGRAER